MYGVILLPDSPCGGEIKTLKAGTGIPELHYLIAPVGARSKPLNETAEKAAILPDSPCGGEIKTYSRRKCIEVLNYLIAPVGARSKPRAKRHACDRHIT